MPVSASRMSDTREIFTQLSEAHIAEELMKRFLLGSSFAASRWQSELDCFVLGSRCLPQRAATLYLLALAPSPAAPLSRGSRDRLQLTYHLTREHPWISAKYRPSGLYLNT
ncbi:hypothetical protein J6590_018662 [Homalodisca vitripennis]|nr:hypothetical protein J6590_018662 [Homalodisca vitripennis]